MPKTEDHFDDLCFYKDHRWTRSKIREGVQFPFLKGEGVLYTELSFLVILHFSARAGYIGVGV